MIMIEKVLFNAELSDLPKMLEWVRQRLKGVILSATDRNKIETASEEVLVNIIHYAYEDKRGLLEIVWNSNAESVSLTFIDFGKPFNPINCDKSVLKTFEPVHQKEGGKGILLVKKLVDNIHYEYINKANRFTIVKKF